MMFGKSMDGVGWYVIVIKRVSKFIIIYLFISLCYSMC